MAERSETVPLLMVSDIEASTSFYCEKLGFTLDHSWEPDGKLAWCRLQFESAPIMLQQDCNDDPAAGVRGIGVTFYIICQDVRAVFQSLEKAGVKASEPKTEFYGMVQTHLTDPDGYRLCFESQAE